LENFQIIFRLFLKVAKAKMAKQQPFFSDPVSCDAPYALPSAAPMKLIISKGQGSNSALAAAPVESDDDFPLFASQEEAEQFLADKKELADNGLLQKKNSLISKYEKEAAHWKKQYCDIANELDQERRIVRDLRRKNGELKLKIRDEWEHHEDVRQAIDHFTACNLDRGHNAQSVLLWLFRTGNMDLIKLEHRKQIRDWLLAADLEMERAQDSQKESDSDA
jgi:hypothetical protein